MIPQQNHCSHFIQIHLSLPSLSDSRFFKHQSQRAKLLSKMSFQAQQNIAGKGISVYNPSSPASVNFNGVVYLFYNGSGNDGIWYTTTTDGAAWSDIVKIASKIGMSVAKNTSPAAVVFQGIIYLFYNGSGNDGTWYVTFNGTNWSGPSSISGKIGGQGFLPLTSPSAVVLPGTAANDSTLYLFWNGAGYDGIFFSTFDGTNWTKQSTVGQISVAESTSPYATVFQGLVYLFWNGSGNDGTWYSTTKNTDWAVQTSVRAQITTMSFLSGTSPTALVLGDDYSLRLFWVGSGGSDQGAWYSDFNGTTWTSQRNMGQDIGGQELLASTNPCTVELGLTPYVFWVGSGQDMWFSSGITFDVSSAQWWSENWWAPDQCFKSSQSFTITSSDQDLVNFIQAHIGNAKTIGPNPSAGDTSQLIAQTTQGWDVVGNQTIAPQVMSILDWLTTRMSNLAYQAQLLVQDSDGSKPVPTKLILFLAFVQIAL